VGIAALVNNASPNADGTVIVPLIGFAGHEIAPPEPTAQSMEGDAYRSKFSGWRQLEPGRVSVDDGRAASEVRHNWIGTLEIACEATSDGSSVTVVILMKDALDCELVLVNRTGVHP